MDNVSPRPLSNQSVVDSKLLDRVLEGLDDNQRARVLDLVVRLGIDADDPLFLVSLATYQLQVLVQDAPMEWVNLFSVFEGHIEQWQSQNLNTLETLALEAKAVHQLTDASKTLNQHINDLQIVLLRLIDSLQTSSQNSQTLKEGFASLKRDLVLTLSAHPSNSSTVSSVPTTKPQIKMSPEPLTTSSSETLATPLNDKLRSKKWDRNPTLLGLMAFTFFTVNLSLMQVKQAQNRHYQQLEQLIERQGKEHTEGNCLTGDLPPDPPNCQ